MSRTDMHVQITYNGKQIAYTASLGNVAPEKLEAAILHNFKRILPELLGSQGAKA